MAIDPERLQAHAPFLRNVARALVRDEHDADDLVQDAFAAALGARVRLRGDLRGWLVGVVRNLARNRRRQEGRRRRRERIAARAETTPERDAVETAVPRAELRRILIRAVMALPEPDRSIVLLRHFDERSAADIAKRLGVTPKTVRLRLRRGRAQLRGELRRRYGKTRWIAPLVAMAGLPQSVAATSWATGKLAAAALVAVGVCLYVLTAAGGDEPVRTETARTAPDAPGTGRRDDAPPPEKRGDEADDSSTPETREVPAAPPEPKAGDRKQPSASSDRRAAVAGVSNAPQEPLPKHGLTPDWGREAIWWSHTGRHYLLAVRRGRHYRESAFDYELFVRAGDAPAPPPARTMRAYRPGEVAFSAAKQNWLGAGRRLARGAVFQLPAAVHVLDREPGAVLFERYNHHGHGNVLTYIDWTGRLRWTLRLEDLFSPAERARFPDLDNSIAWSWKWIGFWVVESRRVALLLSVDGTLIEVALDTGVPRRTDARALLAVVSGPGLESVRGRALEAVAPMRPAGLDALLTELARDGPPALAKQAQELLSRAGVGTLLRALAGPAEDMPKVRAELRKLGRDALGPLRTLVRDAAQPRVPRLRALHLHHTFDPKTPPEKVLDDPAPLLADGLLFWRTDGALALWCERYLVRYGDAAAAALQKQIRDKQVELQARRESTRVLARIRTENTFHALVALAGHTDNIITWHARAGLLSFPAKDLGRRFEALLLRGSPADGAIAEYFQQHPSPGVVEALLRAMERHADDAALRAKLGYAVQRCSGQWVAERGDPGAWRRKLGR